MAAHNIVTRTFGYCQQYLGESWCPDLAHYSCKPLTGGLTNELFLASSSQNTSAVADTVIVRYFGPGKVNNINEENIVATVLGASSLAPVVYGIFDGGRIEEFIPSKPLRTAELPEYATIIASKLATIHSLTLPMDKSGNWWDVNSALWWETIDLRKSNLTDELYQRLKDATEIATNIVKNSKSPVKFCHNDLQELNLLQPNNAKDKSALMVIDFEYAGYMNRAIDVGNHFCEYMYDYIVETAPCFTADLSKYPSKEQQQEFAEAYFKTLSSGQRFSQEEIDVFLAEGREFSLVSHVLWALWAVYGAIQKDMKYDGFDYIKYAEQRLNDLNIQKSMFQ